MAICIAVLDDDILFASTLASLFIDAGYTAVSAARNEASYVMIRHLQPDIVVIAVHIDGRQDWPVLSRMPGDPRTATIPVIVCAHDRFALRGQQDALRERGYLVLDRFNMTDLLTAIETVVGPRPSETP